MCRTRAELIFANISCVQRKPLLKILLDSADSLRLDATGGTVSDEGASTAGSGAFGTRGPAAFSREPQDLPLSAFGRLKGAGGSNGASLPAPEAETPLAGGGVSGPLNGMLLTLTPTPSPHLLAI